MNQIFTITDIAKIDLGLSIYDTNIMAESAIGEAEMTSIPPKGTIILFQGLFWKIELVFLSSDVSNKGVVVCRNVQNPIKELI